MKNENKEMTINDLGTTVENLATKVDTLATTVDNLATKVDTLATTVDNLAMMTARGFERTATKEDLNNLREEMNDRFDIIENIKFRGHENRIERLEDKMLQTQVFLKTKFA